MEVTLGFISESCSGGGGGQMLSTKLKGGQGQVKQLKMLRGGGGKLNPRGQKHPLQYTLPEILTHERLHESACALV